MQPSAKKRSHLFPSSSNRISPVLSAPPVTDFQTLADHHKVETKDHRTIQIETLEGAILGIFKRPQQSPLAAGLVVVNSGTPIHLSGSAWRPSCLVRHPFQVPRFRS
ncbi:hypothetical protein M758_12G049400 [Ceratodon purpureus]|nr:hypothetical protein M758_12G049400 [Ceratodon purpureus]